METTSTKLGTQAIRMFGPSTGRWLGAVMITGLLILVSGGSARGQSRELHDLSTQLAQKISASGKKSVAVVDFTDLQGNVTELGRFLAEELSDSLAEQANGFRVIDRTYLKAILREHKLDATGLIDPATASKLGQISGVRGLITGTIVPLGDNVSLSVKVLDAATETIIAATTVQIPMTPAINALLKTGISAGGSNNVSTTTSDQGSNPDSIAGNNVVQQAVAIVHQEDYDLSVRKCIRARGGVECRGSVKNTSSKQIYFTLVQGYFLDNLGNQYPFPWNGVKVGSSGNAQHLEADLPMNFTVSAQGVNSSATSVSIVLVCSSGFRRDTVTLRHIPIQGR